MSVNEKSPKRQAKKGSNYALGFISIDFWAEYFDVTQNDIRDRLVSCLINPIKPNFSILIEEKVDLYGPFWICALLVFICSVGGNLFTTLSQLILMSEVTNDQYNFEKIGSAVCLIYGALLIFPAIWVGVNKAFGNSIGFATGICIYGYSFFVYVVAGLLCVMPMNWWRWIVMIMACSHSTTFLLVNFKKQIENVGQDNKLPVMGVVFAVQAFMGLCLKLKFF